MTTKITATRFTNIRQPKKLPGGRTAPGYKFADSTIIDAEPHRRLHSITDFIDNAVVQLRYDGGATGISFAAWNGATNHKSNLVANTALMLDYEIQQFEALRHGIARMGYAAVFATTEDKKAAVNAISVIIPFSAPIEKPAQYERLASCIMTELDLYGALHGVYQATHVLNVHATTLTAYERGTLFDPHQFIRDTASRYQALDAHKYLGPKPLTVAKPQPMEPIQTFIDETGLFEFALTPSEKLAVKAGVADLTAYGEIINT